MKSFNTSFNHVVMFLYAKQRIKCLYLCFISFLYVDMYEGLDGGSGIHYSLKK